MNEEEKIEAFIRERGVTRCPTAILAPTSATISPADAAATIHQQGLKLFKTACGKSSASRKYFYGDRSKSRRSPQ